MPRLAVAHVEIIGVTGKYKASIADVKRRTENFGKSATKSIRGITLGITAMGVAAGVAATVITVKLTRAIVRAGKATIVTAVRYDRLKIGLAAVAGGSKEAAIQLRRLEEVAKLPGLSFEGAIAGSTALQAAGLNAILAERSLLAFGNALVTVGKGADDLKGVNLALTQIVTKGQGFGQELRQLAERLPQIRKAMKDAFGIGSVEDFAKLNLSATQFIEGIVEEFEKLPKVAGTVSNELENLGIAFDRLKAEIGKTMLGITSDVAKQLAGIVDNLRLIVDNYGIFREEAIKAMLSVTIIGVQAATAMMQGIGRIIVATSPLIFEPLKNAAGNAFRNLLGGVVLLFNELQKKIGFIDLKTFEDTLVDTMNKVQDLNNEAAENFEKKFDAAAKAAASSFEKELPRIAETLVDALAKMDAQLEKLAERARMLDQFKTGLRELAASIVGIFAPFQIDTSAFLGNLNALAFIFDKNKVALKGFGEILLGHTANLVKMGIAGKKAATAMGDAMQENLDKMRERFENATAGMRNAFSDFIADSISDIDNISEAWQSFVRNMKSAFIRAAADMIANKAVQALFNAFSNLQTQGAGGGPDISRALKQGFGTAIGAFIGNLIAPGIGAVIGGGIGGTIAGSLGDEQAQRAPGMVNNFFETDFANMDRNRMQKTVSQTIAPALAEDALDGR